MSSSIGPAGPALTTAAAPGSSSSDSFVTPIHILSNQDEVNSKPESTAIFLPGSTDIPEVADASAATGTVDAKSNANDGWTSSSPSPLPQLEDSDADDPTASPVAKESNFNPHEIDDDDIDHFDLLTNGQQRMGAIFGSTDDSETMKIESDQNILYFSCLYVATLFGWILLADNFWSFWATVVFMTLLWPYFLIMPTIMDQVFGAGKRVEKKWYHRWMFRSWAQLFSLEDEVKQGKIHWFIPYMMAICLTLNSYCSLALGYVWEAELNNVRDGAAVYTQREQLDPQWSSRSYSNAAQIIGNYVLIHPLGLLGAGFMFMYVSTRTSLGRRGKETLISRKKFMSRYYTTKGTGEACLKIIDEVETTARERVFKRFGLVKNGMIAALSLINGLLLFMVQQHLIWSAWQAAPGIVIVYLFACLFVGVPGVALICVALESVSCFFLESSHWMDQMRFVDVDLTDIRDLLFWQELRQYYLKWKIPVQYAMAETGFGVCLLMTLVVYSTLVFMVYAQGVHLLFVSGIQICFVVTTLAAIYLVQCLMQATKLWDSQQSHIEVLNDVIQKLRFRLTLTSTPHMLQFTREHQLDDVSRISRTKVGSVSRVHMVDVGNAVVARRSSATGNPSSGNLATNAATTIRMQPSSGTYLGAIAPIGEDEEGGDILNKAMKEEQASESELASMRYGVVGEKYRAEMSQRGSAIVKPAGALLATNMRYDREYIFSMISTLQGQILAIKELDPAPSIFGINVKPTLLRVMAGYVISALAVILTKFFQS